MLLLLVAPIFAQYSGDNIYYQAEIRDIHGSRFIVIYHNVAKRHIVAVQMVEYRPEITRYRIRIVKEWISERALALYQGDSSSDIGVHIVKKHEPHTSHRISRETERELHQLYTFQRDSDIACRLSRCGCIQHPRDPPCKPYPKRKPKPVVKQEPKVVKPPPVVKSAYYLRRRIVASSKSFAPGCIVSLVFTRLFLPKMRRSVIAITFQNWYVSISTSGGLLVDSRMVVKDSSLLIVIGMEFLLGSI